MASILVSVALSVAASLISRALTPAQEVGKLSNLKLQNSSYGGMVPIVYGTNRIAGNVIDQTDLIEHKQTSGGKGGPKVTTFTYSASFAIRLCEGPIAEITRIWAFNRIIFDVNNPELGELPCTVYLGTADQLPDPTFEAIHGVGNVSAYRGIAYVVFADYFLTDFDNRIPNLEFEVVTKGVSGCSMHESKIVADTATPLWDITDTTGAARYPAITGLVDGKFRVTSIRYNGGPTDSGTETPQTDTSATYEYDATTLASLGSDLSNGLPEASADPFPRNCLLLGDDMPSNPSTIVGTGYLGVGIYKNADGDSFGVWLKESADSPGDGAPVSASFLDPSVVALRLPILGGTLTALPDAGAASGFDGNHSQGPDFAGLAGVPFGKFVHALSLSGNGTAVYVFTDDVQERLEGETLGDYTFPGNGFYLTHWYRIVNGLVVADGTVDPPLDAGKIGYSIGIPDPGGARNSFDNGGKYLWAYDSVSNVVKLYVIDADGNFALDSDCGNYSPSTNDAGGNTGSIYAFKTGYAFVVTRGTVALVTRFPAGASSDVTLAEIVSDLSVRCGLTVDDIDVTELTDLVHGYVIPQQASGRNLIQPLRDAWFVDGVESDGKIVFHHRGKDSIVTFDEDDLAAHLDGQELPPTLRTVRGQEEDLPWFVSVDYVNIGADYQTGTQVAQSQATRSKQTVTLTLAIAMDDAKGKSIAETHLHEARAERERKTWYSTRKYAKYEPTDVVTVEGQNIRIVDKHESPTGLITWDGVPSVTPVFVGGGAVAKSLGFTPAPVLPKSDTDLLLLDIPLVVDSESPPGFTAVIAPLATGSWPGASLQKSADSGTTYAEVAHTTTAGIVGASSDVLGNFSGGNVFDESNVATVVLRSGSISSSTRDGVLNGSNEWLLGDEILQSRDAVLVAPNTYHLSGHLRGRRGTEWAMGSHQAGERFVVLPGLDVDAPSSDLGREREYKAVTSGKTLASATAVPFTNYGQRLKPYSPVHLGGGSDASGNITLNWLRRTRVGGQWTDFPTPLSETTESYIVQIWDSTYSKCARIIPVSVQTANYSAANQVTDFGATQQTIYFTVGQLGSYGIGRQAQGSVPGIGGSNNAPLVPITPYNNPVVPPAPTTSPGSSCAGSVINTTISWTAPIRTLSGTFNTTDTWVIQFTTGASVAGVGSIEATEYHDGPIVRHAFLALSPCGTPIFTVPPATDVRCNFAGPPNPNPSAYASILPNTTYYYCITTTLDSSGMACDLIPTH